MHVRNGTLNDLDTVHEAVLELAASQRAFGSVVDPAASAGTLQEHLARSLADDRVFVAVDDGAIVGVATVSIVDDALERTETVGLVEYLFVEPGRRNTGIGSRLLARAERALVARGATVAHLEVFAGNDDALRFYRTHGFETQQHRLSKPLDGV